MSESKPGSESKAKDDPLVERSLNHSVKDGVYFALMTGSAESYLSAYAIFLQASTAMVGLLATLPPLLASAMQVVSVWLGRVLHSRRRIIVAGAIFQALCLIPLALLPLIAGDHALALLIPIVFFYLCGPNLGAPQWNSLVGDLLDDGHRGRFFARRTRLSSVASLSAMIIAGLTLDASDRLGNAYWGFLMVFSLASIARFMSAYHLAQMHEPTRRIATMEVPQEASLWRRVRDSELGKFSLFYASMQFAVGVSGPYFTLYMLRDLDLSYLAFMVVTVSSVLVQFLTLNRWGRLSDLFGNRLMLLVCGCLITVIPALWLVSTSFLWILCVQALSGLSWAGFTLSATAYVFDLTPSAHRPGLFALHNILAAIGTFAGAGLGAYLATALPTQFDIGATTVTLFTPLYAVFLFSCLLRVVIALIFLPRLREVRRVRRMSMGGVIFRVTRIRPVAGLLYDIVGRAPTKRDSSPD